MARESLGSLVELHITYIPADLWNDKLNYANCKLISEIISVGFVRVFPAVTLNDLRRAVTSQLGDHVLPQDYVFLKQIGRRLVLVREKQEMELVITNFLPPESNGPEMYILPKRPPLYGSGYQLLPPITPQTSGSGSNLPSMLTGRSSDSPLPNPFRPEAPVTRRRSTSPRHSATSGHSGRASKIPIPKSPTISIRSENEVGDVLEFDQVERRQSHVVEKLIDEVTGDESPNQDSGFVDPTARSRDHSPRHSPHRRSPHHSRGSPHQSRGSHRRHSRGSPHHSRGSHRRHSRGSPHHSRGSHHRHSPHRRSPHHSPHRRSPHHSPHRRSPHHSPHRRSPHHSRGSHRHSRGSPHHSRGSHHRHHSRGRKSRSPSPHHRSKSPKIEVELPKRNQRMELLELLRSKRKNGGKSPRNSPSPKPHHRSRSPSPGRKSADLRAMEEQRLELLRRLERIRLERRQREKAREEIVKLAKSNSMKINQRRNTLRDMWKKRFFEEKKKTSPLEDVCQKLRNQIDSKQQKLMADLGKLNGKTSVTRNQQQLPSIKNNGKIQASKLQHEVEVTKRQVEAAKIKLTGEMKLRHQAEEDVKILRQELLTKKIRAHIAYRDLERTRAFVANSNVRSHDSELAPIDSSPTRAIS